MRLILVSDNGDVLDSTEISREELASAKTRPQLAVLYLRELNPGKDAV